MVFNSNVFSCFKQRKKTWYVQFNVMQLFKWNYIDENGNAQITIHLWSFHLAKIENVNAQQIDLDIQEVCIVRRCTAYTFLHAHISRVLHNFGIITIKTHTYHYFKRLHRKYARKHVIYGCTSILLSVCMWCQHLCYFTP